MKKAIFIAIALIFAGLGINQGIARKPFNPKAPGDEWVELRKAKKASKKEVASARQQAIESAQAQIQQARSLVGKIKQQRSQDKGLVKRQSGQITALNKSVRVARSEKAKVEKRLADRERDIASLQATLKSRAWKRTNWIVMSVAFMMGSFVVGLIVGAFFRRPKVQYVAAQPAEPRYQTETKWVYGPPAPPPPQPPPYISPPTPPPAPPAPPTPPADALHPEVQAVPSPAKTQEPPVGNESKP